MTLRGLAWAAAAVALAAGGAQAQDASDMVGTYSLDVTSKTGADCPDDQHLDFTVRSISGDRMEFGVEDEHDTAEYNPSQKSFRYERADTDPSQNGTAAGRFVREADAVRLYLTVSSDKCTGQLTGTKPAPHIEMPSPTARTATEAPGAPPPELRRGPFGLTGGMKDLVFYAPLALLLIGVGALVGFLVARPKKKPDADS